MNNIREIISVAGKGNHKKQLRKKYENTDMYQ